MEMTFIIIGLFCTGISSLIGKHPNLISGINTMPKDKKQNIDLNAIGRLYKNGMRIIGASICIIPTILYSCKLQTLATISLLAIIFIGIIILQIKAMKYDKNKKSIIVQFLPVIIIICVMIVVSISIYNSAQPTEVKITNNQIEFTGEYGITFDTTQITQIELWESIPKILRRTNGLGLGDIQKGEFNVKDLGRCTLYLQHSNAPYLYIKLDNDRQIIFNSKTPNYTEDIYMRLTIE